MAKCKKAIMPNAFIISAPTWIDEFEFLNES